MTLTERLRAGEAISDGEFDKVLSPEVGSVSFRHWTPVTVARRAAHLLVEAGATRILDVGAGPGKFCIIGALTTGAQFVGIEQRHNLVEEARRVSAQLDAERASFVHSNVLGFDCTPFDGFYFYNPFYEQVDDDEFFPIDKRIERSEARFNAYIAATTETLSHARAGTVVATYHGFGGAMPGQYRAVHEERIYGATLALWVRSEDAIA